MKEPRSKIAFVFYPHIPDSARLETMPFAFNIVRQLDNQVDEIDLYLWEADRFNYNNIFSNKVHIKTINSLKPSQVHYLSHKDILNPVRKVRLEIEIFNMDKYKCVFSVGTIGSYIGSRIARQSNSPFIYINDEFPSTWEKYLHKKWLEEEKNAAANSTLIVVPDAHRARPLCRELGQVYDSEKIAVIPNAPVVKHNIPNINWKHKLGLPEHSIPLLQAGSLTDWAQIPEIMGSVPYWPENVVLILHSRDQISETLKKQYSHLFIPGRMFWSDDVLDEDRLNSLVAYSSVNFSLYRNLGENISQMGWSSGKLLRSLVCGRPVIASKFESLAFVEEHELGILINHPSEIPGAIQCILDNEDKFAQNCKSYAKEFLVFENWWELLCKKLNNKTGISLFP